MTIKHKSASPRPQKVRAISTTAKQLTHLPGLLMRSFHHDAINEKNGVLIPIYTCSYTLGIPCMFVVSSCAHTAQRIRATLLALGETLNPKQIKLLVTFSLI